jgi:catechol 2,3-dioxygenase-like lactoylglutathione lyase family enzyme
MICRMASAIDRRHFLASVPALIAAPRLLAQSAPPQIRVNGLSQLTLTVSDAQRSIDFYQGLFGMGIQARHGTTTLLRIGDGPRFLAIVPAAAGERPSISRFGMGVEQFDVDRVVAVLAQRGVTAADPADASSPSGGPMKVRVTTRGNTREMFVGDPSGVVFQLHDVSYCGGSGPLGNVCQVQASPKRGLIALKDMSHFTINATDPRTQEFYRETFGFGVRAYQATTPGYAVGPGVHFLMFIGGAPAGAGRGGRAGAPAPAPGAAGPAAPGAAAPAAPPAGAPGQAAAGAAPAAGRGRGGAPAGARIDHACMSLDGFNVDGLLKTLADYGIKASENSGRSGGPLTSWVSVRPEARGGAPITGTPELYFSDPDGLSIQLQDSKYCGGGGYLGDICIG